MTMLTRYAKTIQRLNSDQLLFKDWSVMDELAIESSSDGRLHTWYAPLELVYREAPLVLVGLTPAATQTTAALIEAQRLLRTSTPEPEILDQVKRVASFCGPLREGLVQMLDAVGVPTWLGIATSSMLFDGPAAHLLHSTSMLKYPTYFRRELYNGRPVIHKEAFLQKQVQDGFLRDVAELRPDVKFIAVGKQAGNALARYARAGAIPKGSMLGQVPLPVGPNIERVEYFLERRSKAALSGRTNPALLDAMKASLIREVAALPRLPALRIIRAAEAATPL